MQTQRMSEATAKGSGLKEPSWLLKQPAAPFEQEHDHKGLEQQLKQIAEENKDMGDATDTTRSITRLGDKREHLEKRVQEGMVAIDALAGKLKKRREALGEKREKPTTLKGRYEEALTDLRAARDLEDADGGGEKQDAGAVAPRPGGPPATSGSASVPTPAPQEQASNGTVVVRGTTSAMTTAKASRHPHAKPASKTQVVQEGGGADTQMDAEKG